MKRTISCIVVLLVIFISSSLSRAGGSKIMVEHKLTGVKKGESSVTLDYSLHVTNTGNTPLNNLHLLLIPHPPLVCNKVPVNVGTLAPHQDTFLSLQVVTTAVLDAERAARLPLYWAGKYLDVRDKTVEFPVVSKPGGA